MPWSSMPNQGWDINWKVIQLHEVHFYIRDVCNKIKAFGLMRVNRSINNSRGIETRKQRHRPSIKIMHISPENVIICILLSSPIEPIERPRWISDGSNWLFKFNKTFH